MPVIRDIPLTLKTGEVLRQLGFGKQYEVRPKIKSLIFELLASVKKAHLLEPAVAYGVYTITEMNQRQLSLEGNLVVPGPLLPSLLPGAKELAVVVGTIGSRLEKQATDYFEQDESLRGLLLDGIGSAAVDALTGEVCRFMADEASSRGYQVGSPINPGTLGLPITVQWQLLKMVPAGEIGVSLTAAGVMVPLKSISLFLGIGPQMKAWTQAETCARCNLSQTCPYKVI